MYLPHKLYLEYGHDAVYSLLSIANYNFAYEQLSYTIIGQNILHLSPYYHFWLISLAEQYNIIFLTILWLISTRYKKNILKISSYILLIMLMLSIAYSIFLTSIDFIAAYYNLPSRLWQPALGSLLALHYKFIKKYIKKYASYIYYFGLSCLLISLYLFHYIDHLIYPGLYALIPSICISCIIISIKYIKYNLFTLSSIYHLGYLANDLYLIHWPLYFYSLCTW